MKKNMTLSVCILVATLAFWCLNGGENATTLTHALVLGGVIASLLTMPLTKETNDKAI